MRLAILSRNQNLHSTRRLTQEAKKLKIDVFVLDPLDCQLFLENGNFILLHKDRAVPPVDVVLPRFSYAVSEYGLAVLRHFEHMGSISVNTSLAVAQSRDKFRSLQLLASHGIDVPASGLMRHSRSLRQIVHYFNGPPVILKRLEGTQGTGVMITDSINATQSVLETLWAMEEDVLIQRYISESSGRDLRAFVVGDRIVSVMRRVATRGDFRSNIHRGGVGEHVVINEAYRRMIMRSVRISGLGVAGVDILESMEGPKIIEVNPTPGFEGLEAATGGNVARAILQHCVALYRKAKKRGHSSRERKGSKTFGL